MSDFPLQDGQLFLFQGDSITDCGRRDRARPYGDGYASMFIELVTAAHPERDIRFINKGIGGDNTVGLRNRWEDDVIRHGPNWLSVLIGINDLHTYLRQTDPCVTVGMYREKYDSILETTRDKTDARLVLLDPFYISTDYGGDGFRSIVLEIIPQYIAVVDEMAEKYDALHVRTHEVFREHLRYREPDVFCPEPVHPNHTGHMVIATELMKAVCAG